jgi:predicted glycoside hydrolase/deacetylase ChbG (UPF0249 family)
MRRARNHVVVGSPSSGSPSLIVVADDYGYAPRYDEGILEAVRAEALDAVSAMVLRDPDPVPLLGSGVEVGLHLEPLQETPLEEQLRRFEELFGRVPAHIDGHHHCHAARGRPALAVARAGRRVGARVRSVSPRHRRLLRCLGVRTQDRLVGRLSEREPALPEELAGALGGETLPDGLTEWMVHPGHRDPSSGSSYDTGREEDLALLIELAREPRFQELRRR